MLSIVDDGLGFKTRVMIIQVSSACVSSCVILGDVIGGAYDVVSGQRCRAWSLVVMKLVDLIH
jgi:hypothetical protein